MSLIAHLPSDVWLGIEHIYRPVPDRDPDRVQPCRFHLLEIVKGDERAAVSGDSLSGPPPMPLEEGGTARFPQGGAQGPFVVRTAAI